MKAQLRDEYRQDIYDEVVLPFIEAACESGLSPYFWCKYMGVDPSTFSLWRNQHTLPSAISQRKMVLLTRAIMGAVHAGEFPLPEKELMIAAILKKYE